MDNVTEIIPDLENYPQWIRDAFDAGQLFTALLDALTVEHSCNYCGEYHGREVCAALQEQLEAVRLLPDKWHKSFGNTATLNDCANELKAAIGEGS